MEDYWNVPRELIYRERENLNDFGVKDSHSLNGRLFQLLSEQFLSANGADTLLLQCFNNAYYLCTIILLEDLPHLKVDKYEENLLKMKVQWNRDACAASFAMAYEMLQLCEPKYQKDSLLLKAIHHRFRYNEWNGIVAAETFYKLIDKVEKGGIFLSKNEFTPRDIIEVIDNSSERDLQVYAEYICERLAHLKEPRQRMYGADMAIARIKDYLRELCEDSEYDPQKDCFKYADNDPYIRDLTWEDNVRGYYQQGREAIDYYTEHYPTMEENDSKEETADIPQTPETEVLQVATSELESKLTRQIDELKQKIDEKDKALLEALQIIEEYKKPVMELTAKQKIRMEFALQLLLNSGLKEMELNKTKTATLLSLLLDIGHQNCYNYLIQRNYHPQIQDKKTILTIDQFCTEMGIRAFLSTKIQEDTKG